MQLSQNLNSTLQILALSKYRAVEIWSADWHVSTFKRKKGVDHESITVFKQQPTKYIPLRFLLIDKMFTSRIRRKVKAEKFKVKIEYHKQIGTTNK